MSDTEDSGWVVEPPSPDAAVVRVDIADTTVLTPALREALDALVLAMEEVRVPSEPAEVEGFALVARRCPKKTICNPLTESPCLSKVIVDCTIQACPRAFAIT
jgi:hypothetical protein